MNMRDDKQKDSAVNSGLRTASSEVVDRYGTASAEFIKGYKGDIDSNGKAVKGLKDIAKSKVNSYSNKKQQAGFAGEALFESKTNAENIIIKSSERIRRTDALGQTNHTQFDHVRTDVNGNPILDQKGNYTGTSQMKLRGQYDLDDYIKAQKQKDPDWELSPGFTQEKLIKVSTKDNIGKLVNKDFIHYENVEYLDIPTEQYSYAKKYLSEQQDNLNSQISSLEEKGLIEKANVKREKLKRVKSVDNRLRKSVSSKEAMGARLNPLSTTIKEVHSVSHRAGLEQGKTGSIIGGAVSLSRNMAAVIRGKEKNVGKAIRIVVKDTAGAAMLSYTTAYTGTAIKGLMERSGKEVFHNLSKTSLPSMIATTGFEVSKSIKRYLTEEDFNEIALIEELGEKGTGMMAASMGAAVGTAVFPGVGTVVGGMVGYMTSTSIYKSAMTLLEEEQLSSENRMIVEEMVSDALESIEQQQQELEKLIIQHLTEREKKFNQCFSTINASLLINNHKTFIESISELAMIFAIELKFTNFDEFNDFMSDDDTVFEF